MIELTHSPSSNHVPASVIMTQILPNLYLGESRAARSSPLEQNSIKHVLSVLPGFIPDVLILHRVSRNPNWEDGTEESLEQEYQAMREYLYRARPTWKD